MIHFLFKDSKIFAYRRNDYGGYEKEPFLKSSWFEIFTVTTMSMKSRNKKVKLVGFYDCSTEYGSKCGKEKEVVIKGN